MLLCCYLYLFTLYIMYCMYVLNPGKEIVVFYLFLVMFSYVVLCYLFTLNYISICILFPFSS